MADDQPAEDSKRVARKITVLVVDDSSFMRRALQRRIEGDPRFVVVGTAADGDEGIEKTLALRPDVVTLDVQMPGRDGISTLKEIVAKSQSRVVMLSAVTADGAQITLDALELGAVDFIPKSQAAEQIHEKLLAAAGAFWPTRRRQTRAGPPALAVPNSTAATPMALRLAILGSSTGGPRALQDVLARLPEQFKVPIVVAQHMPPSFTAALAARLDEVCRARVVEARDGDILEPGTVYIAPGGFQTRVTADRIKVSDETGGNLYRPSVNVLAASALDTFGGKVLGIMLTGMGNDGAQEFIRLRQAGAHIISQHRESCVVYGMPRAVIDAGAANEILPLDRIGLRLCELIVSPTRGATAQT